MKILVLIEPNNSYIFNYILKIADPERDEIMLFSVKSMNVNMDPLIELGKNEGFYCPSIVSTGVITNLLEKNIQDFKIDLIVCGSPKDSIFHQALFGSTSEYIIQNLSCSVLIVR